VAANRDQPGTLARQPLNSTFWRMSIALIALTLACLPLSLRADEPLTLTARGTVQVAFTPGDDAAGLITATIAKARRQILVQAYSFTHQEIADALVAARNRGVEVHVIADRYQSETGKTSKIGWLIEQGVPVWIDAEHAAAHNKVMILDAGTAQATLITGSFNFTKAGQHRNAENVLIFSGNPSLTDAYAANWRRHRIHSQPVRR